MFPVVLFISSFSTMILKAAAIVVNWAALMFGVLAVLRQPTSTSAQGRAVLRLYH
jgi:hypothetical protein